MINATHSWSCFVRGILLTQEPMIIQNFYQGVGISFMKISSHHYVGLNAPLSIIESASSACGFAQYKRSEIAKPLIEQFVEEKNFLFRGQYLLNKELFQEIIHHEKSTIYPIIRCKDMDETRNFYACFGPWVQEKHGKGPVHYALESYGEALEIYPLRKKDTVMNPYMTCVFKTHKDLPIQDPEGRPIITYSE